MGNITPKLVQSVQLQSIHSQLSLPSSAGSLPGGPATFSTFQLPGTSNVLSVNLASLQECMLSSTGTDLLNNCIGNNIKGLSNQSKSYQNVKYVGPGHSLNSSGQVTFGPLQNFQNIENNNTISKNVLFVYLVFMIIYLFVMLKK
jgi:hypothetical protein